MIREEKINGWLKQVKFKKKLVGGVDEIDVWKKIRELNVLYEEALTAERIRYDSLIEQFKLDSSSVPIAPVALTED